MDAINLTDIPEEIRVGGLIKPDYERLHAVYDIVNESPELEKVLGLERTYSDVNENSTLKDFIETLNKNTESIYFFGLGDKEKGFKVTGAAFHVPETNKNLAFGTFKAEGRTEHVLMNLDVILKDGDLDPVYKRYPITDIYTYFYKFNKKAAE